MEKAKILEKARIKVKAMEKAKEKATGMARKQN